MEGKEVIPYLAESYFGLYLPVSEGMSKSQKYQKYVLQGKKDRNSKPIGFLCSDGDTIFKFSTPAGAVDVILLDNRVDFELFLQKIAYRCEPVSIREDIGAMMISGVINWKKIHENGKAYVERGGEDWQAEFKRFTSDAENFKDRVLVISSGPYSGLSAHKAGYPQEEWRKISICIRVYHECTHYVCRRLYPDQRDPVLDEIIADVIGVLGATGHMDRALCCKFMGIKEDGTYDQGRLGAYVPAERIQKEAARAALLLEQIGKLCDEKKNMGDLPFGILEDLISLSQKNNPNIKIIPKNQPERRSP